MKRNEYKVIRKDSGSTILDYLAVKLGISKKKAKALLDAKSVYVNSNRVWIAKHELNTGDIVTAVVHEKREVKPSRVRYLYKDENWLIIDKPAGILSTEKGSVEDIVKEKFSTEARAAHRLDRQTSGCLLFAMTEKAFEAAVEMFSKHGVSKVYLAIVSGRIRFKDKTISKELEKKRAVTLIRTLDSSRAASYMSVTIPTGRTHQIRKHMALLHHPVLGDTQYGSNVVKSEAMQAVTRQMLHASKISFKCPITGNAITATAPIPSDFKKCLSQFKLH